jgi:hypothetical protein
MISYFPTTLSSSIPPDFGKPCACRETAYTIGDQSFRRIRAYVELGDEVLEKKLLGYRSRAEFVAEAMRDELISGQQNN